MSGIWWWELLGSEFKSLIVNQESNTRFKLMIYSGTVKSNAWWENKWFLFLP